MSTIQTPQDEIAAIQATLALHAQDLARINRQLPEIAETVRISLERQAAESAAAHEQIVRELQAIRERQDAQERAIVGINGEIVGINGEIVGINGEIVGIKGDIVRIDGEIVGIKGAIVRIDGEIVGIKDAIVRIDGEIASIKDEIVHINEQLAVLFARTDAIIARMDAMSATLKSLDSRVGNITGTRLERRVARNIRGRLRRSIGLSQSRILHRDWGETDDDLIDLLDDADERGIISRQERDDALDADLIVVGADADGQRAYAVIEISVTVDNLDVNRAARRARAIAKATAAECTAIVVGSDIPDAERQRAARAGAAVITVPAPED